MGKCSMVCTFCVFEFACLIHSTHSYNVYFTSETRKYLDTSGAIGLNLFDTPSRAASSKQAVFKQEKTIQGPITLAQGNLSVVDEALIARYPVFMDGQNMTIDGQDYPFWGLT